MPIYIKSHACNLCTDALMYANLSVFLAHNVFMMTLNSPHLCISEDSSATLKKAAEARLAVCNLLSEYRNFGDSLRTFNTGLQRCKSRFRVIVASWLANCGLQREAICRTGAAPRVECIDKGPLCGNKDCEFLPCVLIIGTEPRRYLRRKW